MIQIKSSIFGVALAIVFGGGFVLGLSIASFVIPRTSEVKCPPPVECVECPVCPTLKDQAKKKGRKWLRSTLK